jgi:hypothetical protein
VREGVVVGWGRVIGEERRGMAGKYLSEFILSVHV